MDAREVVTAVRRRYGCEHDDGIGPEWAALDEMDLQPGHSTFRIDLLMVRAWGGMPRGHERHAVEVKVSRQDVRREIDKRKWQPWAEVAHRFYLACPHDLSLDGLDLPDEWGILRARPGMVRREREAPRRDPAPLPDRTWIEAFRRAGRAEARIREGEADSDPAATIARLVREVAAAERAAHTARQAEERWRHRATDALRLYADVAPTAHCRCGTPLKVAKRPFGRGAYGGVRWEHDGKPGSSRLFGAEGALCDHPSPNLDRLAEDLDAQRDEEAA